jgi:hypothetical protein
MPNAYLHSVTVGIITFLLMWADWLLTILQEREKRTHHDVHYRTYPVDTIEGSPLLQAAVRKAHLANPRHLMPALLVSAAVAAAYAWTPAPWPPLLLGYVWGMFLIVGTSHLGNLLGYRASRSGLHGTLHMHQRTAYGVQAGRYVALTALLVVLAAASASLFVIGVAAAGLVSTARQLLWMRRVPAIGTGDSPPAGALGTAGEDTDGQRGRLDAGV